jgi:hypothetical protein
LEVTGGIKKITNHFKFNSTWLNEEGFISLVKELWIPFEENPSVPIGVQFSANIKRVKKETMEWAYQKRQRDEKELIDIESILQTAYD